MSSSNKQSPFDGAPAAKADGASVSAPTSPPTPTVMIRKLPRNTTKDTLNSMLLFAKDLITVDFIESQDAGYLTALAKFRSEAGAREARNMLNGKPNSTKDANMIVEILPLSSIDGAWRSQPSSVKSPDIKGLATTSQGPWQSSRFNETFQALDRERVTSPTANPNGDTSKLDGHQNYFLPHSPISQTLGRQSNTGKSMISNDIVDDETGKLLDDPMGFMNNDLASSGLGPSLGGPPGRRSTLPHIPVNSFANLSLNSNGHNMASPRVNGMISPRLGALQSPNGFGPNNIASMGPNASYQFANQNYMRPNFPPINPSDQNPPCNTLYVGNLPMDASEDELKSVFSKQRGYKRLCLRTKANGPMCFVEFEDITCASKALTECYGVPLHNSTKGGIRLSFSKNPLGVRNGQPGSMTGPSAMSPQGPMPGMGGVPFSAASGPPPGLNPPPGLIGGGLNGSGMGINSPNGTTSTNGFPNPLMSPIGTTSSQSMRTPTSAIGQGWNWPVRDNKRDVPASMMGR